MAQCLMLPINQMRVTVDYKVQPYLKQYRFSHYGADCADKTRQNFSVLGMGNGTVFSCGMDGTHSKDRLGNCIVAVYYNVMCNDGIFRDLACRMFHFNKIFCKAGDLIAANTVLGEYGNTGQYSDGAHLHIEFDTDVKYPQYAMGVSSNGKIIKSGDKDTTLSPFSVFWVGENQSIMAESTSISTGWVKSESLKLPKIEPQDTLNLKQQVIDLSAERDHYKNVVDSIRKLLE